MTMFPGNRNAIYYHHPFVSSSILFLLSLIVIIVIINGICLVGIELAYDGMAPADRHAAVTPSSSGRKNPMGFRCDVRFKDGTPGESVGRNVND